MSCATYSLNSEKGGFVTTISLCFNNSMQSCERKSPALPKSLSSKMGKRLCPIFFGLSGFSGVVLVCNLCLFFFKGFDCFCALGRFAR